MGKVICPRHGGIIGILACQHISTAAWQQDQIPRNVRIFLDFEGHKQPAHLCETCIGTLGLSEDAVIDSEYPLHVLLVCPKCFAKDL